MFTGVIHHIGTITHASQTGDLRLRIESDLGHYRMGESIACNGACLTVVAFDDNGFEVELSPETLACTAPHWKVGDKLHLERALRLGDALDGHLVTGHVDGLAKLLSITPDQGSHVLRFAAPEALSKFIAAKGSVTLNGISLTVNQVECHEFTINIIPHTWDVTGFSRLKPGDMLNLEIDLIARYTARLLGK